MKHLILGGAGQLGQAFLRQLGVEARALDRAAGDLLQPQALESLLDAERPAVVLNCAAYNAVDKAESDGAAAFAVNALGPGKLASLCAARKILLVHFSTNYVFGLDESRQRPYREEDVPGPVSVYGASKLAGEHLVLAASSAHLVIRTCGLFGSRAPGAAASNFVATMLRVGRQGKPLRVVDDQVCTPSYTEDVARAALGLVGVGAGGLFHVTNSGACSWYEFARAIFQHAGVAADLQQIASRDYAAAARRPGYSVLDCVKLAAAGVAGLRGWEEGLKAYLGE
jgi:dTDP-4-dehydrorhamnose reductase